MKFSGKVIAGDAYGRTLGYPTANITSDDYLVQTETEKLALGVYAGMVQVEDEDIVHPAAIVVSEPKGELKLEAHLLDFSADLYDKRMTVEVGAFVRPYEKYETEAELVSTISKDIVKIKLLLGLNI